MLQTALPAPDYTSPLHSAFSERPTGFGGSEPLRVTRWLSEETVSDHELNASAAEHLISLCLRATRLELRSGATATFDGVMRAGTLHVTGPARRLAARIHAPCDILLLHVPTTQLCARAEEIGVNDADVAALDGCTVSDPLVEQLAKLLVSDDAGRDTIYATAISQILLTRTLHLAQRRAGVGGLAKWRLRRVQALVEARLAEPLTLGDMAVSAGLSRMHFAAQFRVATGSTPHDYLLCRRIEAAKTMLLESETALAEIALSVGFLAQAHFTTVFKRMTGDTPARWRGGRRDAAVTPQAAFAAQRRHEAVGAGACEAPA